MTVKCKNWKDYSNFKIFCSIVNIMKKYLFFHYLLTLEETQNEDIILENPKRNLTKSEILKREKIGKINHIKFQQNFRLELLKNLVNKFKFSNKIYDLEEVADIIKVQIIWKKRLPDYLVYYIFKENAKDEESDDEIYFDYDFLLKMDF